MNVTKYGVMKIESIKVRNYKVFKDATIKDLPSMCVFLGTNGSGKTTLFDVFGFLSDSLHNNVTVAINLRGGIKEVLSRGCTPEKDSIFFEIKFRNPNHFDGNSPLITYSLEISYRNGKAYINRELLKYKRGNRGWGKPWHFLDFKGGTGEAITNEYQYGQEGIEEKRETQTLSSPDILAIKGLGQFEQFKAISNFRTLLEKWFISNFTIGESRKIGDTGISEHLSPTGDNLAQVTKYINENYPDIFNKILNKLPQRIPGISKVEAKETEDGRIVLKFQDNNFIDPFIARYVSDGTMKMFAYMILLYDPDPHPLLCIEEPENYLHPDLLIELAEEIREYSNKGGQVFVSTHSPDFVNAVELNELFFIEKDNGYSQIRGAKDDELTKGLFKAGNQLGWLWRNRYLKGANVNY